MPRTTISLLLLILTIGCSGDKSAGEAAASDASAGAPADGPVNLADAGPRGDPTKGEEIFNTKCVACHQKDGTGMGGVLGANFVANKVHLAKPDSLLLEHIAEGFKGEKAVMPPQKDLLTEDERKDALAYIREKFGDK